MPRRWTPVKTPIGMFCILEQNQQHSILWSGTQLECNTVGHTLQSTVQTQLDTDGAKERLQR